MIFGNNYTVKKSNKETSNVETRAKKSLSLAALCLGFFMVIMDVTVVNVALPNMALGLHAQLSDLQWVVAGYSLTLACFLLFAGHLSDQVGAKQTLVLGLIFFVITSFACGIAPTINFLILFRFLQGMAAAALMPASLALINASYDDKKERVKAIGIWGGVGGIAAASGPVIGAVLTSYLSWRFVFFINIPIGLITVFLVMRYVVKTQKHLNPHFDLPGQFLGIITTASFAFVLIEIGRLGWSSLLVITASMVFVVSLCLFILVEKHVKQPMFPLGFFKLKNFSISVFIGMLLNTGLYGELFILPLYFQQIRGYSVMQAGFAIFPLLILVAISSYLSGRVASHKGEKLPLVIGLVIGMVGFFSLLIVGAHSPQYFFLLLPLAMIGFGTAFAMPASTIIAIHAVPTNRAGIASAAFNTSRQLGSLIGVAAFGTIIVTASSFMNGMHITLIIAGLLFLLGSMLSYFMSS